MEVLGQCVERKDHDEEVEGVEDPTEESRGDGMLAGRAFRLR